MGCRRPCVAASGWPSMLSVAALARFPPANPPEGQSDHQVVITVVLICFGHVCLTVGDRRVLNQAKGGYDTCCRDCVKSGARAHSSNCCAPSAASWERCPLTESVTAVAALRVSKWGAGAESEPILGNPRDAPRMTVNVFEQACLVGVIFPK